MRLISILLAVCLSGILGSQDAEVPGFIIHIDKMILEFFDEMNEMARQTKTAVDVFNPNFFNTLVDFVTEFIALIVENVMGATGDLLDTVRRRVDRKKEEH